MNRALGLCAFKGVSSCDGGLSGEHYISRAVLDVIAPDGRIFVQGTPWASTPRLVASQALTANILCRHHNSMLSDLDAEAGRFAAFLREAQVDLARAASRSSVSIFNGRIFERWLLKVLLGMWVSGNLASGGVKIVSPSNADLGPILLGLKPMPSKWGLYVKPPETHFITSHEEFEIVPRSAPDQVIKAGEFKICRLPFSLLLGTPGGDWGVRRPAAIILRKQANEHQARLTWGVCRASKPIIYDRVADAPPSVI